MLKVRKHKALETKIGHKFRSVPLLDRSLAHSSVRGGRDPRKDNERLEFIGDRVLGLAIAEWLSETHPEANEGELARRFNRLVRGEACTRVARRIGLGQHLYLSESEADSGGREKATILADALEALLGAIFLDAGFDKARTIIRKLWEEELVPSSGVAIDPKSALQEWAQGQGLALPTYKTVGRKGPDHAPRFTAEVLIDGHAPVRGEGASKRTAEQSAASAFMKGAGLKIENDND